MRNSLKQIITINIYTMKTKIYSKIAKLMFVAAFGMITLAANAQFILTSTNNQTPIEERKGLTSTYSIPGPATDEYTWQVVGGTVVVPAVGVTGSGTVVDPYVVPWAVGRQSIQVQWAADDNTITSVTGNVSVQRRVDHATVDCPSEIQSMDVTRWSAATIRILNADYELCSGDATLAPVTVQFTGAPDFAFKYTVTGLDGVTSAEQVVTAVGTSTYDIAIPLNLLNTSSTLDQTYVVTITEMYDGFTGLGTIVDGSFTITVHPTIETGDITSNNTLTRR
jgi:hypothetical protein